MATAYVTIGPVSVSDNSGNQIPVLRGRPTEDASVTVGGTSVKVSDSVPTLKAPDNMPRGAAAYAWRVTALDANVKVVAGLDPNASTGKGYRLAAGSFVDIVCEEPGETLALVTI